MSLSDALKNLKFDNRMTEINLRDGKLTVEEIQKHLAALVDVKENAEKIIFEDEKKKEESVNGAAH